jgi:hypothetical protein
MKLQGMIPYFQPGVMVERGRNSTATTWALYAMTKEPEIQTKLREELLSVDTETPSMDELMALPYLDAVVRETLRVHSPVPSTVRIAMKDDVIPVDKPYKDKYGVAHDSIRYAWHVPCEARLTMLPSALAKATPFSSRSWQSTDRRSCGDLMHASSSTLFLQPYQLFL